ncbi:hypothetical protein C0993_005291, partial [Termitomyces sp. T159_Od127]
HTKLWCILVDDTRVACLAHYKAKRENHNKKKGPAKLTVMLAGGTTFTVKGNPDALVVYIASQTGKSISAAAKTEFAGLASDDVPDDFATAESLEINT